jgi:ABC-type nitrate/sulfonate/bicarbonate transport system permease component
MVVRTLSVSSLGMAIVLYVLVEVVSAREGIGRLLWSGFIGCLGRG